VDTKSDKLSAAIWSFAGLAMHEEPTTAAIQRYLEALPEDSAAEPIIRELLERAGGRWRLLCATLLYKSYPRLTRSPMNLETDELFGSVVAGLLTALRATRPPRPFAGSSRWPTSTCAGSSMTWPAAWMNSRPPRRWRNQGLWHRRPAAPPASARTGGACRGD
jgi:hypothetical protein